MKNHSLSIVLIALLLEGALLLTWIVWKLLSIDSFVLNININSIIYALIATLPLFLLNYILFFKKKISVFQELLNQVVVPLCRSLNIYTAAIISIIAGLCEEVFFRDFLNTILSNILTPLVGIFISSLIFGVIHFLGQLKRYYLLVIIYTFIGIYFSLLVYITNSLFSAILAHAVYDFLAIMYVRACWCGAKTKHLT